MLSGHALKILLAGVVHERLNVWYRPVTGYLAGRSRNSAAGCHEGRHVIPSRGVGGRWSPSVPNTE